MLDYLLRLTDTSQSSEDMDAHGVQKIMGRVQEIFVWLFWRIQVVANKFQGTAFGV